MVRGVTSAPLAGLSHSPASVSPGDVVVLGGGKQWSLREINVTSSPQGFELRTHPISGL